MSNVTMFLTKKNTKINMCGGRAQRKWIINLQEN